VLDLVARVRDTDSPVLVEGESGTGKELVARSLHFDSARREMPFVAVNCATLQESLLESELFGHKAGAYTGATQDKPGLFEIADRGTLFIDEIAEAATGVQAKLLRVLETGEFRAVGDVREKKAKVRVVAATNRVLRELAEEGKFRKDLYFRLNVVSIRIPPLRERKEDLKLLVEHFLMRSPTARVKGVRLSDRAMAGAMAYDWPGNVRELFNCLERATLLANGRVIDDLGLGTVAASTAPAGSLEQVELEHIQRVLNAAGGNVSKAAEMLGVSRRNLHRKINQFNLKT
jgi:transcriptional regulator with PAS, ATPase and Fis domain